MHAHLLHSLFFLAGSSRFCRCFLLKKYVFLFSLNFIILTGFAQGSKPHYVVAAVGDTLRGRLFVTGEGFDQVILISDGGTKNIYSPAEARSFGSAAGPIRVSKRTAAEAKPQFMLPLVEGYANLYSGKNEQGEKRYYIQEPGAVYVTEVARASSQLVLARALPGCSTLDFGTNEFQRLYPYSTDGMTRLVAAYNSCLRPRQPSSILKRNSGWQTSFEVKAGVHAANFSIAAPAYEGFNQRDATGYQAGLALNVATLSHVSAQVEAVYMTFNSAYGPYEAYYSNIGLPSNQHTMRIKYAQIQVPLLLRYEFGHRAWRPFLNVGPSLGVNINNSSVDTYPSATSGQAVTEPVEVEKLVLGAVAGGGIAIYSAFLPVLSLELRVGQMGGGKANTSYFTHLRRQNSVQFDASVRF